VAYDRKRDEVLAGKGLETMRFKSGEVGCNLPAVVALIADRVRKRTRSGKTGGRV
jgi:very-short-patch-repair endonuclease